MFGKNLRPQLTAWRLGDLVHRGAAGGVGEFAGVGEAKAGVPGSALGQRRGEHADLLVVVVVDFGRGLAFVGAQDPPGVLQETSLAGHGRGEEQGVQRRAVNPSPA